MRNLKHDQACWYPAFSLKDYFRQDCHSCGASFGAETLDKSINMPVYLIENYSEMTQSEYTGWAEYMQAMQKVALSRRDRQ
jgi:hypothetical protein